MSGRLGPVAALGAAIGGAIAIVTLGPSLAERLIGTTTPESSIETIFTLVVFGAMLVAGLAGGIICRVRPLAPGRRPLSMLAIGTFVGLFGVTVTTGYSALAGALRVGEVPHPSVALLGWGAAMVLVQAGAEEVYFRGWLQPTLARGWGTPPAIVVAALAFMLLHLAGGARAPLTLVNLLLGGMLFGMLAALGGGIVGAVAAHFAWNAAEQLLLGLDPNPGIGGFGSVFDFELVGAQSWGGSEEGLNASYAMTFVLLAMLVPMVLLLRRRLAA